MIWLICMITAFFAYLIMMFENVIASDALIAVEIGLFAVMITYQIRKINKNKR